MMRQLYLATIFTLLSYLCFCQDNMRYDVTDMKDLNSLVSRWETYWNIHDMDSMGNLLSEDVDFVNVAGQWLKGKKEAVAVHKERHLVVFKTSVWNTDSVRIKYVKPDLAIIHIGWGITGDVDPDGKPRTPRHGLFTWVVTKRMKQWLILAVHNVNIRESGAFMNSVDDK
jgi:uncharacterized protein (TIGR02246 family)